MKKILMTVACALVAVVAVAKDKIGIAEPAVGSQFTKDDALAVWDELEAAFHSDEYTLVSRAALKQMMTEIGLTTSSDLLNMNSTQKAKLKNGFNVSATTLVDLSEVSKISKQG